MACNLFMDLIHLRGKRGKSKAGEVNKRKLEQGFAFKA